MDTVNSTNTAIVPHHLSATCFSSPKARARARAGATCMRSLGGEGDLFALLAHARHIRLRLLCRLRRRFLLAADTGFLRNARVQGVGDVSLASSPISRSHWVFALLIPTLRHRCTPHILSSEMAKSLSYCSPDRERTSISTMSFRSSTFWHL